MHIYSYIRVSTAGQGRSGLGIEAQRTAIARFAAAEGLELQGEFVEVETGKGADALERRPVLRDALAQARCCLHLRADGAAGAVRGD
jgi:DNA invertase Pin-like site-specific DNA recombinase